MNPGEAQVIIMFENLFGNKKYQSITPKEVKEKLDRKDSFLLFDVRNPDEYAGGHLEHSISLPLGSLASHVAKYARSKDAEIVVYCLSGARSSRAAAGLSQMGYTNVKNMGGISSWPYAVVR